MVSAAVSLGLRIRGAFSWTLDTVTRPQLFRLKPRLSSVFFCEDLHDAIGEMGMLTVNSTASKVPRRYQLPGKNFLFSAPG